MYHYISAILAEIYYCEFWHCINSKQRKNKSSKTWGEYRSSNCSTCQEKCTRDPNCEAIECDYFDSRPCIWWKSKECEEEDEDERTYSEKYKTCVKPRNGNIIKNMLYEI